MVNFGKIAKKQATTFGISVANIVIQVATAGLAPKIPGSEEPPRTAPIALTDPIALNAALLFTFDAAQIPTIQTCSNMISVTCSDISLTDCTITGIVSAKITPCLQGILSLMGEDLDYTMEPLPQL